MAEKKMKVVYKLRHDTAANWTLKNPILRLAEPAVETDTGRQKVGDGVTPWSSLPYTYDEVANEDIDSLFI